MLSRLFQHCNNKCNALQFCVAFWKIVSNSVVYANKSHSEWYIHYGIYFCTGRTRTGGKSPGARGALPAADQARAQRVQRSKKSRVSVNPMIFSGTANGHRHKKGIPRWGIPFLCRQGFELKWGAGLCNFAPSRPDFFQRLIFWKQNLNFLE